MSRMPYYRWFPADYLADTAHLSPLEDCLYRRLLDQHWRLGSLPLDETEIRKLSRYAQQEFEQAWPDVRGYFIRRGDRLIQPRMQQEIEQVRGVSDKRSRAAGSKWSSNASTNASTSAANALLKSSNANRTRAQRLSEARKKGRHTAHEWAAMLAFHEGKCAKCGSSEKVAKDHIIPIYQGGSDGIENLQPLCQRCNGSKGPDRTDYRIKGWNRTPANAGVERLQNASYPDPDPDPDPDPPDPTDPTDLVISSRSRDDDSPKGTNPTPKDPPPPKPKAAKLGRFPEGYPAEFVEALRRYPRRAGGMNHRGALGAWNARLAEGRAVEELVAGIDRYAAFCRATSREGTEFVLMPSTFLGPSHRWAEDWRPPPPRVTPGGGRRLTFDERMAQREARYQAERNQHQHQQETRNDPPDYFDGEIVR